MTPASIRKIVKKHGLSWAEHLLEESESQLGSAKCAAARAEWCRIYRQERDEALAEYDMIRRQERDEARESNA